MELLVETLQKLDLKKNEAEVYISLFKHGQMTSYDLAKKTKIIRTNIYDILQKLLNRGLITKKKIKNKIFYFNNAPNNLLSEIDSKRIFAEEIVKKLLSFKKEETEEIEFYEGKNAILSQLNDLITAGGEFKVIGANDYSSLLEVIPDFLIERLLNLKKIKKIKTKMIVGRGVVPIKNKGYEYLYLDVSFPLSFLITPSAVLFGRFGGENPKVNRINSKNYIEFFDNVFELIWNTKNA